MDSRPSTEEHVRPPDPTARAEPESAIGASLAAEAGVAEVEMELAARGRLFDEVLAGVELVLEADGVAFWREEPDHGLVLTAHRSISSDMLAALDSQVVAPLQSIMRRWPDSPLVAIPLEDPSNPLAEEIRALVEKEGISGLAGVPCRIPGEMLGMLCVVHKRPHAWTVRELGLATGFAGQLATALENSRLFASVRSMASRLAAIHELSLRLAQLRDADTLASTIVAELGRLVECDTVRVYRQDPADGVFRVAAASCGNGDLSDAAKQPEPGRDGLLAGTVAKRNEAIIVPDADAPEGCPPEMAEGPWSMLMVPMSYGDEVQGVLAVSRAAANAYGPQDEQALSIFGRYAAQAIVNAGNISRLESQRLQLERQVAGERRLLGVSEQLVSTLDPRRVLEQMAESIGSVVHYDRLTIYRRERHGEAVEAVLSRTRSGDADAPCPEWLPLEQALTEWVIERGEAVCANDARQANLPCATDPKPAAAAADAAKMAEHNIVVVPLRVQGEAVGSLNLIRVGGSEAHFTEPEFELSKLFAGQASIALQNAEAHFTVSTRADLDALTGLRNHGTFQRDVDALIDAGETFSLVMMDLDFFKAFNDTYGHPAGDTLLQSVAGAVVAAIRQNDRAYRYGGDEFALLLMSASRTQAEEVAARIQSSIREAVRVSQVGAAGLPYGASAGVAHWPEHGASKAELVRAADKALYEAKRRRGESPTGAESAAAGLSDTMLDAARDLLAAGTVQAVARATLRHGAAIVCSRDGLVAMPAKTPSGNGRRRRGGYEMHVVAGLGRFHEATEPIRRGEGFWGRVWASGSALAEDDSENGILVGAPMASGGVVWGVVGFVLGPGVAVSPERLRMLDHVATLAGAAAQRRAHQAGAEAAAARSK